MTQTMPVISDHATVDKPHVDVVDSAPLQDAMAGPEVPGVAAIPGADLQGQHQGVPVLAPPPGLPEPEGSPASAVPPFLEL